MKIYISGPITGHDKTLIEAAFAKAEKDVLDRGHTVVNPLTLDKELPEDATWNDYMKKDIKELVECDGIYMIPGWVYSKGCNLEYAIAKAMDLLIFDQAVRIPFTPAKRRERRRYGQTTRK